jgi:hypothetical protein
LSRPARFSQQARREIGKALREMEHKAAQQALHNAVVTAARRLAGTIHFSEVRGRTCRRPTGSGP